MGGYVTVPGGAAARLMGIPLVLHEQNSVAGLANRGLARIASGVIEAFPQAFERAGGGALGRLLSLGFGNSLNARVALLGNPVRGALARLPGPAERADKRHGPLTLLIVGGSLGARALNETVPTALALLAQRLAPEFWPQVVHQSGRAHLEPLRAAYAAAGVQAQVIDFIDDMTQAYSEADLVICRAGAATVAELAVAGVAALLVPYPHAVDDHQTGNARWLTDAGAAWLQPQAQWSAEGLADQLVRLAQPASAEPASADTNSQVVPAGRAELVMMAERARSMAFPDAAERVADFVESLARRLP
jgi:UDP-N-acetylglucosamine--N-acetylmuramyl-(pentapeptide) pyrophosphoryl-undecaprenol N-acetylglucosamine transferase